MLDLQLFLIDGSAARSHRLILVQTLHVLQRRPALNLQLSLNLAVEIFLLFMDRLIFIFIFFTIIALTCL